MNRFYLTYFITANRLLGLAGLACMAGLTGCSSVFYYPDNFLYVERAKLPVQPEDVYFTAADGTKLHGWFFPAQGKPLGKIVHFHGNAQNLTAHFLFLRHAPGQGFHHFIFDYRGYGQSEGKTEPAGLIQDGKAAMRWIRARDPDLPLIVFGQSLGGAVALKTLIEMKGEVPVRMVAVDSTFASYRSEARKVMTGHWLTWLFSPLAWLIVDNSQGPGRAVSEISPVPLLVVHGDRDRTVHYSLGKAVFEYAKEPKEFWTVPGGRHTEFLWREGLEKKFFERLKTAAGSPPAIGTR
jgi:uncharacterized protein